MHVVSSKSPRSLLLALTVALLAPAAFPTDAEAGGCTNPVICGGIFGSCCPGYSCAVSFCVPNCQGEDGPCTSSSQCCGDRVCELFLCQTMVGVGDACGPFVFCTAGLVCDPFAGFRCVDQTAELGDACGPLVQCVSGLVCDPFAGFRCVDQTADLGDACGPLVQCVSGLVCDPFAGFVCVDQSVGEGEACGPLVQCQSGLVCDPLAGFTCVAATTPGLGQACGPLFPCDDGLVCDPLAGFVCVDQSSGEDEACGPLVQCAEGLFCDPLAGFRCVSAAGVDQPCGPGVPCESGLQCTLGLRCSHEPAQAGETCDITAPCGDGLYCQPGLPQRCQELRKIGEGCSVANPCIAGASCEACFVEGCNAAFQCFWNSNNGAITEQQCRTLYSPGIAKSVYGGSIALTFSAGNGIGAVATESQAFGTAYGQDGRYGCYTTLCGGVFTDVGIEAAFVAVGFYTTYDSFGGSAFVNMQSAQTPFDLLSFSTSQIYERFGDEFPPALGDFVGTEDALGIGAGLNPAPFTAGSFYCWEELDTLYEPGIADPPLTLAVAPAMVRNPGFVVAIDGWSCLGQGACSHDFDDALGKADSGSGEVESPPPGVDPGIAYLASPCTAVTPNQLYALSAWVKTAGARPGTLIASWNAGLECDGPLARRDELGVSPPDDTWRSISIEHTAPAGAQSVQLLVSAERNAATGAGSLSRIDFVRIPEPSAGAAAAAALLTLAALARRRATRRR